MRKIQYQAAKLEFIEELFFIVNRHKPDLETELFYDTFSTLRQDLYDTCGICFHPLKKDTATYIAALKTAILSTSVLLSQSSSGLNSTETQTVFLKEMLTGIISELTALSLNLTNR